MITLDYSNVLPFIGGEEAVKRMEPQVKAAHDMLHKKNGPGNDFLGWLDLPTNYDKEEFARIKKAAAKIRYPDRYRYRRFLSRSKSCNRAS